MIQNKVLLNEMQQALVVADGPLDPAALFLQLFIAGPAVTPNPAFADFTKPVITLYAPQPVTSWNGPDYTPTGQYRQVSDLLSFHALAGFVPTSVLGFILTDVTNGGDVLAYVVFDTPIDMVDTAQRIETVITLVQGNGTIEISYELV